MEQPPTSTNRNETSTSMDINTSTNTSTTTTKQPSKLRIVRKQNPPSTPSTPSTSSTSSTTTFSLTSTPFIPSSHKPQQPQESQESQQKKKRKPRKNRNKKSPKEKSTEESSELTSPAPSKSTTRATKPSKTRISPPKSRSPIQTKGIVATKVDDDDDDDDNEQTEHIKDISKQLNAKKNDPNAYLCPICMDVVKRTDDIWECHKCWNIFHITCITHWADSQRKINTQPPQSNHQTQSPIAVSPLTATTSSARPTNTLFDYIQSQLERQQPQIRIPEQGYDYPEAPGTNTSTTKETALKPWTCPCCRSEHSETPIASCFCGKCKGTHIVPLYNEPHSCGEMCGRLREGTTCPHPCTLVCHPGPCPPCPSMGAPLRCHCGKTEVVLRCGEGANGVSCGGICGKPLSCGNHFCQEVCHPGPCRPCAVQAEMTCYCGKRTELRPCSDRSRDPQGFSCGAVCDRTLACGNHRCQSVCHPGPCRPCQLTPEALTTCPCGKARAAEIAPGRRSCAEPVPTCGEVCGKRLPFCAHTCGAKCHTGPCPPCSEMVTVPCRCGATRQTVECHRTLRADGVLCDNVCTARLGGKRHRCGTRCCPVLNRPGEEHICMRICGRPLPCGHHTCELLCHAGRCPPCTHVTYDAVACRCGRTVTQPPIPCGAMLAACPYPCSVERPCGHNDRHLCHFGDCPPCIALVDRMCSGGHRLMKNVPCHMTEVSCGGICGKTLQCGEHTCQARCHAGPCPDWQPPKDASWYSENRKKKQKKKKKNNNNNNNNISANGEKSTESNGKIENENNNCNESVNNESGSNGGGAVLSCGQVCGRVKACGHRCRHMCHPGTPCPEEPCMDLVQIHCGCGVRTTEVHCFCAMDAAEKLECDDVCREIARRRTLADAFGIRPADGTVPAYSSFLIYFARSHKGYVAELEETLAKFIADADAKMMPIDPRMDPTTRKFVFALSKYYGLSVFTDRDQAKSFTKLSIAAPPAVLLSRVAGDELFSSIATRANEENTRAAQGSSSAVDQEDHTFSIHLSCEAPGKLDKAGIVEVVRAYGNGAVFVPLGPQEGLVTARDENTLYSIRLKLAPLSINIK